MPYAGVLTRMAICVACAAMAHWRIRRIGTATLVPALLSTLLSVPDSLQLGYFFAPVAIRSSSSPGPWWHLVGLAVLARRRRAG